MLPKVLLILEFVIVASELEAMKKKPDDNSFLSVVVDCVFV